MSLAVLRSRTMLRPSEAICDRNLFAFASTADSTRASERPSDAAGKPAHFRNKVLLTQIKSPIILRLNEVQIACLSSAGSSLGRALRCQLG